MCRVSARRLSIRISLLNNCKKDFQFHIKLLKVALYTKYRIFFIWISSFWALMTPGCILFFWIQHKISDWWIGHTTYISFMTNKFRFWALMAFNWASDPIKYIFWAQHKILHQIKPKNIKIGLYFTLKWKRSQKFI
jgi:hypothetical protein